MDWISYVNPKKEDPTLQAILLADASDIATIRQLWLDYVSAALGRVISNGLPPVSLAKYLCQISIALRHGFPDISHVALEGSVVLSKEALRHTPQEDDDRAAILNGVMVSLMCRYEVRKDIEDLLTAFRGSNELMAAMSKESLQPDIWTNLGQMAFEMFRARGRCAASEAELEPLCQTLWSQAKSINIEDYIEGLSGVIHAQDFGSIDCLDVAAWCAQMALAQTSSGADNRMSLRNLRSAVSERYRYGQRKGDLEDLQVAISISTALIKQAVDQEQLTSDYEHLIGHLNERFAATRKEEDLNVAMEKSNEGILAASSDYPKSAVLFLHHAKLLRQKHQLSRETTYLTQSLSMAQNALLVPSHDRVDIARSGSWLHVLSVGLSLSFQQTHDPEDMDRAIEAASKAVKAAEMRSTERDYEHATIVCSLAALLVQRYEISHAIGDINLAALLLRELRRQSPEDHQDRDYFMSNLVMVLGLRYNRLHFLADVDEAIAILRRLTSQKPRDRYLLQARLCTCLYQKYLHTHEHKYFQECFEEMTPVLNSLPLGAPDSVFALAEISLIYKQEADGGSDKKRRDTGLIRWLELAEQAVELGSDDLRTKQMLQHNLGLALLAHFHKTGQGIQRAISTLRIASDTESFELLQRIECALDTARALSSVPDWQQVYSVLEGAIHLLPLVSSQTRSQDDQQFMLGRLSNLASMGCSAAIEAGKTSVRALELLEGARGAICSLIIDEKSDISHLEGIEPDLYRRYLQLQRETVQPSSISATEELDYATPMVPSSRSVETAINALREVVDQIRAVDGFERFQLPPSSSELKDLAREGPLVSFAVSEFRSDAIIVTKSEIKTLSLPGLSLAELEKHKLSFTLHGNEARRDVKVLPSKLPSSSTSGSDAPTSEMSLLWLWKVAIRPVLDSVDLLNTASSSRKTLPHIWWVGGGLMSLMPLHAAGDHSASSTENTISHVISSYASTFKALRFAKEKPWVLGGDGRIKLLAVAMPKTAGHADLNVAAEISSIEQHVRAVPNAEIVHANGKADMMDKLKSSNILHCACHGGSDPSNPLDGGLLLGDTHEDRLTLRDLKNLSNELAQIAYLSACSTAELRDQTLVEESIHMASMFQLIGFRHVIGTMWGAYDHDTVQIASEFYQLLLDPKLFADKHLNDGGIVAFALHHATLRLRKKRPEPEHWAPFVHFGP